MTLHAVILRTIRECTNTQDHITAHQANRAPRVKYCLGGFQALVLKRLRVLLARQTKRNQAPWLVLVHDKRNGALLCEAVRTAAVLRIPAGRLPAACVRAGMAPCACAVQSCAGAVVTVAAHNDAGAHIAVVRVYRDDICVATTANSVAEQRPLQNLRERVPIQILASKCRRYRHRRGHSRRISAVRWRENTPALIPRHFMRTPARIGAGPRVIVRVRTVTCACRIADVER
jgi:hypothetical protein